MRAGIGAAAWPVTANCAMCCETRNALFSNSALRMRWPWPVCARSISAPMMPRTREHAAHDVVDGGAGAQRTSRRAGHVGEPAHHLHGLVERRAVLVGTGQEALQRAIDEAGIAGLERVVAEAKRVETAGAKVLDQHVGARDQLLGECDPLGRLDVELEASLVAIERRKEAGAGARQPPCVVALAHGLDLDHVGAEIAEDQPAARAHHHVGEFDDADARKRKLGWRHRHAALPAAAGVKPLGRPAAGTWP